VNFAFPDNENVQIIDAKYLTIVKSLTPGKAVLHMEFTPRGEQVWVSARDDNQLIIYDTYSFKALKKLPAEKPSGIFFSSRAHKMGL
jgi:protein NirF